MVNTSAKAHSARMHTCHDSQQRRLHAVAVAVHCRWWMGLLNAFSGGVFLSAGLMHLLPHCEEAQAEIDLASLHLPPEYPLVGVRRQALGERCIPDQVSCFSIMQGGGGDGFKEDGLFRLLSLLAAWVDSLP